MAHAEKCPVCLGIGKVNTDDKSTAGGQMSCHGCGGKGWIEVQDYNGFPLYPYYWPNYPPPPLNPTMWNPITITYGTSNPW
jgi:hypothetical protein